MPPSKLARLTLGFIFIYQGLVPKLMFLDKTELYLNQLHLDLALVPVPVWFTAQLMAKLAGIGEILLGLLIIIVARKNWPIWLAIVALIVLLLDCVLLAPHLLTGAFNPLIINIAMLGLAWIALQPQPNTIKLKF